MRTRPSWKRPFAWVFAGLLGIVAFSGSAALAASSLPGGASSLQEVYQDWRLSCVNGENGPSCRVVQEQVHQESGQRVLAVELVPTASGGLAGTFVLPLGLRLDAGVTVQVDDGEASQPLRFSTCLPGGCQVPVAADEATSAAWQAGETLKLAAQLMDGRTITFSVPLNGFAAAFDRARSLLADS